MAFGIGSSSSVTLKALVIGAIVLVLLIPLGMLRGLVSERSLLREETYGKVAEGWGGSTVLGGPMIVVPTERTITTKESTTIVRSDVYVLPARLDADVDVDLEPEPRRVGIYEVPVYLAKVQLQGEFDAAALQSMRDEPGLRYLWQEARLHLPLSQVRSLREIGQARLGEWELKLGPAGPTVYRGIEARIDATNLASQSSIPFAVRAVVAGSRGFSLLPLGSTTTVKLRSDWPHPSFNGAFLPAQYEVRADGFNAQWQVLELNRPYRQVWSEHEVSGEILNESAFGVGLYQPVDVYQRGERSIKYAALFIALTFLTFFAWEQLTRIRLHPLQYLLVGLALSTFYLLLIALSEHIAFSIAYVLSAVALVMLIGAYIAGALRSRTRGFVAGAAMTGVYGLLYVLVLSEDYALLLGAIVLFAALAAVMLVTRKIDWYRLGTEATPADR